MHPRSEINGTQKIQPSGSKNDRSTGVHASYIKNTDIEDGDHLLRASGMKELGNPTRLFLTKRTELRRNSNFKRGL